MMRREFRFFTAWDYEFEELWLNHMSAQGWQLKKIILGMCFLFEKGQPNQYRYALELCDPSTTEDYEQFLSESGIDKIGDCLGWKYFRKENDGTSLELFSNTSSKIKHWNRIKSRIDAVKLLLTVLLIVDYVLAATAMWMNDPWGVGSFFGLLPCVLICLWLWGGSGKIKEKIIELESRQNLFE